MGIAVHLMGGGRSNTFKVALCLIDSLIDTLESKAETSGVDIM